MNGGTSLAAEAHRRIIGMILEGQLPAGAALQEARLGEALGMSRTPVREAIKRIESEGLAVQSGRFLRVRSLGRPEVEEVFFLRLALEPAAARAAIGLPAETLSAMEARVRALLAGTSDEDLWSLDDAFHGMILEAAGNRAATDVVVGLRRRTAMFDHAQVPERTRRGMEEHLGILAALAARDADAAGALMQAHVTHARDAILRRLDALEQQKAASQ